MTIVDPRTDETIEALLESLPDEIQDVCAIASDPLEIAASLEAQGISSRVASDRFGELNVFSLAQKLFDGVAPQEAPPRAPLKTQRHGGLKDLARGAMFAVPGTMFAVAIKALHLKVPSWTFLLALTTGWAFGQAIAAMGSTFAGRNAKLGSLALWWLLITASVTASLAVVGNSMRNGGATAIEMAIAISLYVVSCSILLLNDRVKSMALPLVPAAVIGLLFLSHRLVTIPVDLAAGVTCGAIAITIALAMRGSSRFWRIPKISRADVSIGIRYFFQGMFCGLATSLIIVLSTNSPGRSSVVPLASYPVLITLGIMEWQLYSFRSRAQRALRSAESTRQFAHLAWRAFLLSIGIYLFALVAVCVAIAEYLSLHHAAIPTTMLVAESLLGCTFFVGLIASTCSRIGVVLFSGTLGLTVYAGLYAFYRMRSISFDQSTARFSCCVAIALSLTFLIIRSRRVIRSTFSYQ